MNTARVVSRVLKPTLFILALAPAALLVWKLQHGALGANPVEKITHFTGEWALRFLWITLAITPLQKLSGWNAVVRFRRMLGLYAFFYACLHLLTYVWLDQFFSWPAIARDVLKRPYITVGFTAFMLLLPLAVTSTNAMIRRLGGQRWKRLHKLVYVAACAAAFHFLWLVKADTREPLIYMTLLVILLVLRLRSPAARRRRRAAGGRLGPGTARHGSR
jgi:methionine sulfoxide reductase heme-binding subunit